MKNWEKFLDYFYGIFLLIIGSAIGYFSWKCLEQFLRYYWKIL